MNTNGHRIAVTGANGYIGYSVCRVLHAAGFRVRPIVRRITKHVIDQFAEMAPAVSVGDLAQNTDWNEALSDVECVIHTAATVHKTQPEQAAGSDLYSRVNTDATLSLAAAAKQNSVQRFVFLSSVGVYGPIATNEAVVETMQCSPADDYSRSKLAAEEGLLKEYSSSMQIVIIRPPMVYGPSAPGNIRRLARLVRTGVPLPFSKLQGRRNLIGIDNLCSFIQTLAQYRDDASGVWNVADADDVDLPEIVRYLSTGMGRNQVLFPVPVPLLSVAVSLLGQRNTFEKLNSSLRVDSSAVKNKFGWIAPTSPAEGLVKTGRSFQSARES